MSICCVVVGFAPANLTPRVRVCLPSQFNTCKLVCIYRLNLYSLLLYMLQYSNLSIERQPWLKWTWIRYCLKVLMHKCVVRYSCLQQMRFTWFDFSSCKSFEVHFELVLLISLLFSKLRWFLRENITVPGFARICILDFFECLSTNSVRQMFYHLIWFSEFYFPKYFVGFRYTDWPNRDRDRCTCFLGCTCIQANMKYDMN